MPPEIETARLRLYPPRPEDLEPRLAMDRDPAVMHFIRPIPEDVVAQRTEIRSRMIAPPRGAFWHVEELAAPGFIGWCGLFPLEDSGLMEIGYRYRARPGAGGWPPKPPSPRSTMASGSSDSIPSWRSAIRTTPPPTRCCVRSACVLPEPQRNTDASWRSSSSLAVTTWPELIPKVLNPTQARRASSRGPAACRVPKAPP